MSELFSTYRLRVWPHRVRRVRSSVTWWTTTAAVAAATLAVAVVCSALWLALLAEMVLLVAVAQWYRRVGWLDRDALSRRRAHAVREPAHHAARARNERPTVPTQPGRARVPVVRGGAGA